VVSFLDAGSLVLHVSEQHWPVDTLIMPPFVRDGLTPSLTGASALACIQGLLADPVAYRRQQKVQATAYARRCRGAHETLFDPAPAA
jgi:hypothetical protein